MRNLFLGVACMAVSCAAAGLEEFSVTVDPGIVIGPVKDMHAVSPASRSCLAQRKRM